MTRYLSEIRRQLQDASDLFATRYGRESSIAEVAVKTLISSTQLERELVLLDEQVNYHVEDRVEALAARSV